MKKKITPAHSRRTPLAKPAAKSPSPADTPVRVVALGASAGGLEALEVFLRNVPAKSGLAFVVIQHLDPTREGIMPELLQRATDIEVVPVRNPTKIQPDRVYVIPPNRDMSILHGFLHLSEPSEASGLRLPIDFFFRSLALDQQARSIGVIMSGMGSDGTLGLRAIKEQGGVALVQSPASAKFDSMPRSAIDAGLADIVAPAEELPGKILAYLQCPPVLAPVDLELGEKSRSALEKTVILLRAQTGHDFSLYKRNTLYRRIERRMGIHQIASTAAYVRYLRANPQELDLLFKELLIGVTNFFRDPATWEQWRTKATPALLADHTPGQALRAWVPGCSTGEEAYSLAMVFREAIEQAKLPGNFTLQIFATDLDHDAIDKARSGLFPLSIATDVSPERLLRFFIKEERGYRVRNEIRKMVIFAEQNLIMDPPFTKLDILSCRNLLIYLGSEVQKKLIPLFHYSLNRGGMLFLGSAESIGSYSNLFTPFDLKSRIFRRVEPALPSEPVTFPASFSALPPAQGAEAPGLAPTKTPLNLQSVADQLMLRRYAPAAVLVNERGDITYVSGRTGRYLEPAMGKANWNLFAMAREELRSELARGFPKALRQKKSVELPGLRLRTESGTQRVNVTLQRIDTIGPLHGLVIIVFTDVPTPAAATRAGHGAKHRAHPGQLAELEAELAQVRTEARAKSEEMQTYQEELRSANEELQSTNEELQSTNEELTTSKEEMQSLNEELQTLNGELQAKVEELSRSNDDIRNLLNSTDIATLFLDNDLKVRRFTPQATTIVKLIPGDVGRPITDLVSDLDYPALPDDVRGVLRTLVLAEKQIATRDGRWFGLRIMPYRTIEERVDGVVITFANITEAKTLEAKLRAQHATLQKLMTKQSKLLVRRKKRQS